MPLVYMDTNVVDVFLRNNIQNVSLFQSFKKNQDMQFLCSIDLLTELAINPNVESAKTSLRIINSLCSFHLYVHEPKALFRDEFTSFFTGKPRNPYYSRVEAKEIFQNKVWHNLTTGKLGPIREWLKELKKQRFTDEKKEYEDERKDIEGIQIGHNSTFEGVLAAANATTYPFAYMTAMVRRQCERDPSKEEIDSILGNLGKLPVVKCCLLHDLAYKLFFSIKGKRPDKHGNNIDARHTMAAANAEIFITDDRDFLGLLKSADTHWPFSSMSSVDFCKRYAR